MRSPSRLVLVAVAITACVAPLVAPAAPKAAKGTHHGEDFIVATPPQTAGLPDLDQVDPVRYSYDEAIVSHHQVAARDGVNQIWVDVIRPNTTAKVPAIMMSSPYFNTLGRGFKADCKTPTQSPPGGLPGSPGTPALGGCTTTTPFPEWYDEYFVPRGYAFIAMDLRGTRNTSGCQQYGDRDEVFDAVDTIDWAVSQDWSNGKVGMTGGSYDGTIANGAAVEMPISGKHPDALAAIIPIRAIDRWYDYHFINGVMSEGHAATPALFTAALAAGDLPNSGTEDLLYPVHLAERKACIATLGAYTDAGYARPYSDADDLFWAERDFAKDGAGVRAAVFVMHGLFDFNVKPLNAGHMWAALPPNVPKKLWWTNTDHLDPRVPTAEVAQAGGHLAPFPFADRFVEWNHRWWCQFLKGLECGALAGPPVEVQQRDGTWLGEQTYPAPGTTLALHPTPDGGLTAAAGDEGTLTWTDDASSGRVFVATEPFEKDTHVSGQLVFDLMLSTQGPDTTVAAVVDDLPPGVEPDDFDSFDTMNDGEIDGALTVTYGWVRAWYRSSVSGTGRPVPKMGAPMVPLTPAKVEFPSLHTDYLFPAGHRMRVSFSNSAGGTVPSLIGGTVTLDTAASTISVPVAAAAGAPAKPVTKPQPKPPVVPQPRPNEPLPSTGADLPTALAMAAVAGAALLRRRLRVGD